MVDFRKMIPVLAVIAFMLGSAITASAQNAPFQCFANGGVSTPARAEGLTELVGDLVLNCQGGVPTAFGAVINPVNIQLFLNTALTSRLLTSSTSGINNLSEALLLLDEPSPANQFGCVGPGSQGLNTICQGFGTGNGNSTAGYYGSGTTGPGTGGTGQSTGTCTVLSVPAVVGCPGNNRNVFQGIQTTSNSVTFLAVPIDPPGSNTRTIRITNIRGNANALGVAGSNATPTPIVGTVSPNPPQFLPVSNPSQTLAFIQRGLTAGLFTTATGTTVATASNVQQCNNNRALSGTSSFFNSAILFLRYTENFATAFKQRFAGDSTSLPSSPIGAIGGPNAPAGFQPGFQNNLTTGGYNTESGFVNPNLTLPSGNNLSNFSTPPGTAGLADWGTRFVAVFNNIPNGVSLYVDVASTNLSSGAKDIALLTASETGVYSAVGATGGTATPNAANTAQLTVTNGSATAVWEEIVSDPNTFASIGFGVYIAYTASPGTNSPALGTTTVNLSYGPRSTVTTASSTIVPRFADTSTATNIFTVVPCLTTLLFPFVTNSNGFDTGIAISSTSTDPFGTTPQSGTCTLNWYGTAFTGATPTPTINSGTSYTLLVSTTLNNVTGGFTGYMIAVCRFQYAHGFAFISDLGARNLAMGYLALVIPDPTSSTSGRLATPMECGGASAIVGCASTGENLAE
jgi:hypothetical protein